MTRDRSEAGDRRAFLGLGIAGSVGALLAGTTPARGGDASPQAAYTGSSVHDAHPLEFRLDSGYRPDLSDAAARTLVRAVAGFLDAEHPGGLTMTFWDLSPRDMPFLGKHLELVVEHVFRGVEEALAIRPVDPIVVLALLYNESRFHPKVVSPAGAVGMAQFMPDTASEYGLAPLARPDLWARYRATKSSFASDRASVVRDYRARHGGIAFSADAAIDRALETGSLDVLGEYRAVESVPDPSQDALREYVLTLERDFAGHEFFWDGREALGRLDRRVSYDVIPCAVRYLARALDDHQGFASTAVAAYNAGPGAVRVSNPQSILHRFGDIPTYTETIRYVQRFLAVYSAIKYRVYRTVGT